MKISVKDKYGDPIIGARVYIIRPEHPTEEAKRLIPYNIEDETDEEGIVYL